MTERWTTFLGASDEQVTFGGNADPRDYLTVGQQYQVDHVDVHYDTTDIYIKGYPQKGFNSVCFDLDIEPDCEAWRARQGKEE